MGRGREAVSHPVHGNHPVAKTMHVDGVGEAPAGRADEDHLHDVVLLHAKPVHAFAPLRLALLSDRRLVAQQLLSQSSGSHRQESRQAGYSQLQSSRSQSVISKQVTVQRQSSSSQSVISRQVTVQRQSSRSQSFALQEVIASHSISCHSQAGHFTLKQVRLTDCQHGHSQFQHLLSQPGGSQSATAERATVSESVTAPFVTVKQVTVRDSSAVTEKQVTATVQSGTISLSRSDRSQSEELPSQCLNVEMSEYPDVSRLRFLNTEMFQYRSVS